MLWLRKYQVLSTEEIIGMGVVFVVSPERSSERDYVITDSVRSMYVVCT